MSTSSNIEEVVRIVSAAQGELVGRTRLQKAAFLLDLAGMGKGLSFNYKHYGPFSEELATAADIAPLFFDFNETQKRSSWGGNYSIFSSNQPFEAEGNEAYMSIVSLAKEANPVALELAATAAFLAAEGNPDPWGETARRKPEKARGEMLDQAKKLYARFRAVQTPKALPNI